MEILQAMVELEIDPRILVTNEPSAIEIPRRQTLLRQPVYEGETALAPRRSKHGPEALTQSGQPNS